MARVNPWLVVVFADLTFIMAFVLESAPDGFDVLHNASTLPGGEWQFIALPVVVAICAQSGAAWSVQGYLRAVRRSVRWDHLLFVLVFSWGSWTLPLFIFDLVYRDYFPEGGHWLFALRLSLLSIPVIPIAFILVVTREVLAARRARLS